MKKNKKNIEEPIPFDGTVPENTPLPDVQPNKKSNKKKKIAVVCVLLVCLLGGICWYFIYANPNVLNQTLQDIRNHITGMYGSKQSYIYYPIDHDLDITTVEGYMELDRDIHYKNGSETIMITDANSEFTVRTYCFLERILTMPSTAIMKPTMHCLQSIIMKQMSHITASHSK